MPFDVVMVAEGPKISLAAALNILISRRTCPEAKFCIAVPEAAPAASAVAYDVIQKFAARIVNIPAPQLKIEGKLYRIENKINALRFFGSKPVICADSDLIFIRPLPADFLFRPVPAAVPEHGLHEDGVIPWEKLYSLTGSPMPEIKILLAGGGVGPPWLNAGFVVCPDATSFGDLWHRICRLILHCPWVPERWPYLDQIALPLAFAEASPGKRLTFDNVLPARFNQNLFYWAPDQEYINSGYVAHHHCRVPLIEKYLGRLIEYTRQEYPIVIEVLEELKKYQRLG